MKSKQSKTTIDLNSLLNKPKTLSEKFHEATKHTQLPPQLDPKDWPKEWKTMYYKGYSRLPEILLPKPQRPKENSLTNALEKRASERTFSPNPVSLATLSTLLHYSVGLKARGDDTAFSRFYPSGGARYPIETYLLSLNTELENGLYHYYLKNHSLEKLTSFDLKTLTHYVDQPWIQKAGCLLLLTAIFQRTTMKYGDRGYRLVLAESGHIAQNLYLLSASLDLSCCATNGFIDDKFNELIDIDGIHESIIYTLVIGNAATI